MTANDLADYAGMTRREVTRTIPLLEQAQMLDRHDSGAWRVLNWQRRQFETDNVTARTQKHRAKDDDPPDRNVPTPFPGTPINGSQERSPSRALATESETETDHLTSSRVLTTTTDPPDDDHQAQPAHDPADQGTLGQLVGAALAILVERDLDARQANPQLAPIADPGAWRRIAHKRRTERGQQAALVDLARAHPDADPRTLADLLEPPTTGANGDRYDHRLDGQQQAMLAAAEAGQAAARALAAEPLPDDGPARVADIRAQLPGGTR